MQQIPVCRPFESGDSAKQAAAWEIGRNSHGEERTRGDPFNLREISFNVKLILAMGFAL